MHPACISQHQLGSVASGQFAEKLTLFTMLAARTTSSCSTLTSRRHAASANVAIPCVSQRCVVGAVHASEGLVKGPSPALSYPQHALRLTPCRASGEPTGALPLSEDDVVRVATIGDMVTIHYTCKNQDGEVLDTSHGQEEDGLTFELGSGEVMGNKLFQGFDEAVRGLAVGQRTIIEATGGEWKRELLFAVPRDHPEVIRLEGRYKNQGGLQKDMLVELANGAMAVVIDVSDTVVKLDANNMMAGKVLSFEIELINITKPEAQPAAAA